MGYSVGLCGERGVRKSKMRHCGAIHRGEIGMIWGLLEKCIFLLGR